jgi:hypothetical protein
MASIFKIVFHDFESRGKEYRNAPNDTQGSLEKATFYKTMKRKTIKNKTNQMMSLSIKAKPFVSSIVRTTIEAGNMQDLLRPRHPRLSHSLSLSPLKEYDVRETLSRA